MVNVKFAKLHKDAKIPNKLTENAGMDIYAAFDEDYMILPPHETKMIPTGLCSAFSEDYVAILKERGSTGTKGMGQRSGIVDSGYRGEWFVPITNHNTCSAIIISKLPQEELKDKIPFYVIDKAIIYPYTKAIAQVLFVEVPQIEVSEDTPEAVQSIPSLRGTGALGSSGK